MTNSQNNERKRLAMYFLSGIIIFGTIFLSGEIDSLDISALSNTFLRIDGSNSPANTIDWGGQNLVNLSLLNATTVSAENYYSGEGNVGMTGACGSSTTLTVEDGLIIACV